MMNHTTSSNHGAVVSVRGSVVDVPFDQCLPPIYSVLHAGPEGQIVIEVLAQLDARHVRGIALTPTQGLARGMPVEDTGGPLRAPVGKNIISRHPLLRLALFRIRTFRAAVGGSFFTRLGIGGIPFLFPLLYQVGLGFTPIQSGLLMMPQALAAMSLKLTMPGILTRFGYRGVLISNTVMLGLMIVLFATIGAATPVWLIVLLVFCFGFLTSLQYTSMNTLVYADVTGEQTSSASTIASTMQQMSISFGVASASLAAAVFIPDRFHSSAPQMIHGIHQAFLVLGGLTVTSAIVFRGLKSNDGDAVSQHKAILVLSRQNLPTLDRSRYAAADGLRRGAYVLSDAPNGKPELILLASGSEVGLIVAAAERLQEQGIAVRCVSMPSWELFEALPQAERDVVLPPSLSARLAVELGVPQGWDGYIGARGDMLGVERFGASAPAEVVLREYGFTVDNVCARAKALLAGLALFESSSR